MKKNNTTTTNAKTEKATFEHFDPTLAAIIANAWIRGEMLGDKNCLATVDDFKAAGLTEDDFKAYIGSIKGLIKAQFDAIANHKDHADTATKKAVAELLNATLGKPYYKATSHEVTRITATVSQNKGATFAAAGVNRFRKEFEMNIFRGVVCAAFADTESYNEVKAKLALNGASKKLEKANDAIDAIDKKIKLATSDELRKILKAEREALVEKRAVAQKSVSDNDAAYTKARDALAKRVEMGKGFIVHDLRLAYANAETSAKGYNKAMEILKAHLTKSAK